MKLSNYDSKVDSITMTWREKEPSLKDKAFPDFIEKQKH